MCLVTWSPRQMHRLYLIFNHSDMRWINLQRPHMDISGKVYRCVMDDWFWYDWFTLGYEHDLKPDKDRISIGDILILPINILAFVLSVPFLVLWIVCKALAIILKGLSCCFGFIGHILSMIPIKTLKPKETHNSEPPKKRNMSEDELMTFISECERSTRSHQ